MEAVDSLIIGLLDLLAGEVEVLWLHQGLLLFLFDLLAELWHEVVLVMLVVSKHNVIIYFWGGKTFIDAGVNIKVSVLWDHAGGDLMVISEEHWVAVNVLRLSLGWGLFGLSLGISSSKLLLLLSHHSLVVLRVDSTKLNDHTVVELTLVDSVVVARHWDLWHLRLRAQDLLSLLLLIIPVLRVDIVSVSELHSHTIIELTLVNSVVVTSVLWLSIRLVCAQVLLSGLLLVVPVLGMDVVNVSNLKGDVIVEVSHVNGWVVLFLELLDGSVSLLKGSDLVLLLLLVNLLLDSVLDVIPVLGVDVESVSELKSHAVVKLILVDRGVLLAVLWLFLLSHELLELVLSRSNSVLPVWRVVRSLHSHTVVNLIKIDRCILLTVVWLLLLSHELLKFSLSRGDSIVPVWRVILELNSDSIINLFEVNSLVVMALLLSLSISSRLELLLGESISGSINLIGLLLGLILGTDGLLELSSLLVDLLVPELRVVLVTDGIVSLESDLIWGNTGVDIVEVNSLNLLLGDLMLSKLLSLLSLLSLLLSFLFNSLSLALLSSLLSSDLLVLLDLHFVLELISLLLDHLVPLLGVVVVIRSLLSVIIDILSVFGMWDVSIV